MPNWNYTVNTVCMNTGLQCTANDQAARFSAKTTVKWLLRALSYFATGLGVAVVFLLTIGSANAPGWFVLNLTSMTCHGAGALTPHFVQQMMKGTNTFGAAKVYMHSSDIAMIALLGNDGTMMLYFPTLESCNRTTKGR